MKISWRFFMEPGNIPYLITILIALAVAVLPFFLKEDIEIKILMSAVLLVLSAITGSLLFLQNVLKRFENRLDDPTIGEVLQPFHELEGEIRSSIKNADEIWLLSRTGQGWWNNFNNEFMGSLNRNNGRNKAKFLFLDPNNGALEMIVKSGLPQWNKFTYDHKNLWANNSKTFLDHLKKEYGDKIDLKVIDHFFAWTLIIINPHSKTQTPIIYGELATYHASPMNRPVFKVTLQDAKYFNLFKKDEFERMWGNAREW